MGTSALAAGAANLPPIFSTFPGSGATPALRPQLPAPQRDVAALLQPNQEQALTEAFEGAVYRSLESRQSLSLQFSSLQGVSGGGDAGNETVGFEATQLQFDFFQETRFEELALFSRRANAIGEGLDGPRQSSFHAASQQIASRFELSISISGAALYGFNNTAEGAAGSDELIDRLLEITRELLGQADTFFNDFFSALGGDGEFSAESLNAAFNEFVSGFLDTLSAEFLPALGNGGAQNGEGATAKVSQLQSSQVQLEFSFQFSASVSSTTVVQQGDPIVLDLDGDGIELSSYRDGASFDMLGSGRAQQVAFVQGGDAFLALDRNGDGKINSGKELFGEQHGARNGFEELRRFDTNGDNVIDRNDLVFDALRLFQDDGDGVTEAGELLTLAQAGIASISLNYRDTDERAAGGNRIAQVASYIREDGSRGTAADALLNYIA